MVAYVIQELSRSALMRNQGADVEDMPWDVTDHVFFSERQADAKAAELALAADGRFVYRAVPYDLERAA